MGRREMGSEVRIWVCTGGGNEEILLFFAEGLARVDFFLYLCGGFELHVLCL